MCQQIEVTAILRQAWPPHAPFDILFLLSTQFSWLFPFVLYVICYLESSTFLSRPNRPLSTILCTCWKTGYLFSCASIMIAKQC